MKTLNNKIITADIETLIVNKKHVAIAISSYDNVTINTITIDFTKELESQNIIKRWIDYLIIYTKKDAIIYFHNLGRFDGFILMTELKKVEQYKTEILMRENIIYEIKIESYGKRLIFKDSYLMLNCSLERAALDWNTKKYKEKYDFDNHSLETYKKSQDAVKNLIRYVENDVKTLWEVLKAFNETMEKSFNIVNFSKKLTLYSLTQYIFLKQYYKYKFVPFNERIDSELRVSYLGGNVDIYKPYGKDLIMLDFNSMYPSVMSTIKLGIGRPIKVSKIENLSEFCDKVGFLKIEVICKENLRQPLLCIKHKDKIVQPVGNFTIVATNSEINYCLKKYSEYYDFKPLIGWYFEDVHIIFQEFIEYLYKKRRETNNPIYKKMMNSLYGRFGMNLEGKINTKIIKTSEEAKFQEIMDIEPFDLRKIDDDHILYNYKNTYDDFDGHTDLYLKIFNIRVDWAAQITALARIKIQELKEKVDIYYVDTDAIVIKREDLEKIKEYIDEEALGKLKIVTEMDEAIFISPKCYAYNNNGEYHFVIKGAKRADIKETDKDLFEKFKNKLNKGSTSILEVDRTNNFKINHKDFSIGLKLDKIRISMNYDKREKIYNAKGIWIDTKPLKVEIREEERT